MVVKFSLSDEKTALIEKVHHYAVYLASPPNKEEVNRFVDQSMSEVAEPNVVSGSLRLA
ncbi:MAG: hypothetical protein MPF33_02900 [Candidatus Aramenus sp.]|nr:hypothetical protein [Candidatus Aramenus sp.]